MGTPLFCDAYDAQAKAYCKRLKVVCEHFKEPKLPPDTVCGFPFVRDVFVETGDFCCVPRSRCNRHFGWERLRRAQIDLERYRHVSSLIAKCVARWRDISVLSETDNMELHTELMGTSSSPNGSSQSMPIRLRWSPTIDLSLKVTVQVTLPSSFRYPPQALVAVSVVGWRVGRPKDCHRRREMMVMSDAVSIWRRTGWLLTCTDTNRRWEAASTLNVANRLLVRLRDGRRRRGLDDERGLDQRLV
ncbi:unnamed protein product [Echinostoma caproni]|uniref:CXXC-type zinc finger protein 1 n=1 Tax=Echinostoma caproni TaxID=27848 RepID=A0A183AXJ0_9TREM|nr:unnamed protein product [Echinostoma caproni]